MGMALGAKTIDLEWVQAQPALRWVMVAWWEGPPSALVLA